MKSNKIKIAREHSINFNQTKDKHYAADILLYLLLNSIDSNKSLRHCLNKCDVVL